MFSYVTNPLCLSQVFMFNYRCVANIVQVVLIIKCRLVSQYTISFNVHPQMYSCGSLAPKMGRGSRGGGCMDHQFRKPSEPWELADGYDLFST